MNKELILILGGARSGKSSFAQRWAGKIGGRVTFLATAEAGDDEMVKRIAMHKASRPASWHTVEEPLELDVALNREAGSAEVILVDCLTLWLSNILIREGESAEVEIIRQVDNIAEQYRLGNTSYIMVSGEVGLGLVPPYPLGRDFRDILGRMNQKLAQSADKVFILLSGIPLEIKSLGRPWLDLISEMNPGE